MQKATELAYNANIDGTNSPVCSVSGANIPNNPCKIREAISASKRRTPGFRYRPDPKPAAQPRGCFVYFVSTDEVPDFPVKIGYATESVERRLKQLQTGCPYKLSVLAVVDATTSYEWIVHKELHAHRLEGEWFRRTPEVLAEVKEARKRQAKLEEDRRLHQQAWEALPESVRKRVSQNHGGADVHV